MILKGKTVLITGASSGIGYEFAKALHLRGCKIVAVARRADKLSALKELLEKERGDSVEVIVADISSSEIIKVINYIESHTVDILINNAGRGSFGEFEEIPIESEEEMVSLNVLAPMKLTHAAIPQMKQRREGALIAVSSIAAFQPLPFMATYAATKAFNFSHALGLRFELAPFNIRVLSVNPGPVETEFAGVARIPGMVTGGPRDSAIHVVEESLRALERDNNYVVPCLRAKLMWLMVMILPRSLSTFFTGRTLKSTLDAVKGESLSAKSKSRV